MFISSCSQEDSNPMFETNSETHINNLESKALPSVLVTIWIRKQVSFGQYVAITGDGAELGNWTPANSIPLLEDANQENYHSASVYLLKGGEMILILLFLYHQTSLVELLLWFILGINFHGKDC